MPGSGSKNSHDQESRFKSFGELLMSGSTSDEERTVEEMFVKGFVKKTPEKRTFIPQPRFSLFFAN